MAFVNVATYWLVVYIKYFTIPIREISVIYKVFLTPSSQLDAKLAFQWTASNSMVLYIIKKLDTKCESSVSSRNTVGPSNQMVDIYHAITLIKRFGSGRN